MVAQGGAEGGTLRYNPPPLRGLKNSLFPAVVRHQKFFAHHKELKP